VTDAQKAQDAILHLRRMTVPWKTWEANVKAGKYKNPGATEGGKAKALLDQIGKAAPVPPPAASPFGGIGVFTAWDNNAAIGLPKADWVAIQLDAEGGGGESVGSLREFGHFARVFGWQARPDNAGVQRAVTLGLDGYIGQAESADQYEACLALQVGMPHAMVGNVGAWWDGARVKAHGWELILECYENAQPGVWDRLDSKGYPVASTLYGCYDASGEQADGRRVLLSEYLHHYPVGDWCVYLAETLAAEDRAVLA
jgi:hypothetical protein